MRKRTENRVENRVQILPNVLGQKSQYPIAVLLQQLVLLPGAPVRDCIGQMLRAIQFDHRRRVGTEQIDFQLTAEDRRSTSVTYTNTLTQGTTMIPRDRPQEVSDGVK